ncbi:MAG: glutamate 5-kinase [Candidatus Bathyarchaeia archaeon]
MTPQSRLIVVKVGTSSLTNEDGSLNVEEMGRLVDQVAEAVRAGNRMIIVTSGAIASGVAELGIRPKPRDIIAQQVAAAAGQAILMAHYRELFKPHGLRVAQVLLTQDDLSNRTSYVHVCNVLDTLLQLGVVPIINENDVTSIDEIIPVMEGYRVNFSDNDVLSALIANATEADLLVVLSDVDGLYTKNPEEPGAELIPVVEEVTSELKQMAEGKGRLGRGGMKTKLQAAEIVTSSGVPMVIANSQRENVLGDILAGRPVGTLFKPTERMPSRKRWIAYGASVRGQIVVNEGAKRAMGRGASLLPIGVVGVSGSFDVGDVVSLTDQGDVEFARGIANYTSEEANLIKGVKTDRIEAILGYVRRKELVTRKYAVLWEERA